MRALLLIAATLSAYAPNLNPISWTLTPQPGKLILAAKIADRYKLFSPLKTTPGPIPLRVRVVETDWINASKPIPPSKDDLLTGEPQFTIPYKLRKPLPKDGATIHVEVQYQSCSDEICLPPTKRILEARLLPANPVL